MEGSTDFEMPSPKRQKTESPLQTPVQHAPLASIDSSAVDDSATSERNNAVSEQATTFLKPHDQSKPVETTEEEEQDMLDVLMQHVESEAASKEIQIPGLTNEHEPQERHVKVHENMKEQPSTSAKDSDMIDADSSVSNLSSAQAELQQPRNTTSMLTVAEDVQQTGSPQEPRRNNTSLPQGLEPANAGDIDHLRAVAEVNGLPPTSDTLAADHVPPATDVATPTTNEGLPTTAEAREWETDSSPYDSSSSDDSSTDSDSSDDDDDDDDDEEYTLLDPYEQARILMAEDGGGGGDDGNSDDEGRTATARPNAGLRTVNEKPEEILPKPNITITENMPIEELGSVQAIVENTVLITANTSGEYRVLESHSLLCTASRIPIGVVAETLGRVEAPLYTVRFASEADVKESGVNEKGTKVYYVPDHSTFVFTQPLKAVKGSDASNFHDEEVGDDEMEFSDDEAEAEHKRRLKLRRKGIDPASVPPPSRGGRGGRGQGQRGRGGRGGFNNMHAIPESDTASAYGSASVEMNYDDVEEGETDYTPLRRPDNLAQTSPHQANGNNGMSPPQRQQQFNFRGNQYSRGGRGGSGGRGRGNPNHNNRARGGRGGGGYPHTQNSNNNRTSYNSNYNQSPTNSSYPNQSPTTAYFPSSNTSMYSSNNNYNNATAPSPQTQQFHALPPPPPPPAAPYLTPTSGPYGTSTGSYTIPPSPMTPLPAGNFTFGYDSAQYQGYGQQQQQNQWAQYHANLNQYQQMYGGGNGSGNASTNADAIAQVQRTLEELRRASGNGGYNAGQQ